MENSSGTAQPLYLQVIDLDLNEAPEASFTESSVAVTEGYDQLSLEVIATSSTGIDNVKLYVDGEFLRQENVAPYEWGHAGKPDELLGLSVGDHTVKAVVTGTNGVETETSINVKVNAPLEASFTQSSVTVTEGYNEL